MTTVTKREMYMMIFQSNQRGEMTHSRKREKMAHHSGTRCLGSYHGTEHGLAGWSEGSAGPLEARRVEMPKWSLR